MITVTTVKIINSEIIIEPNRIIDVYKQTEIDADKPSFSIKTNDMGVATIPAVDDIMYYVEDKETKVSAVCGMNDSVQLELFDIAPAFNSLNPSSEADLAKIINDRTKPSYSREGYYCGSNVKVYFLIGEPQEIPISTLQWSSSYRQQPLFNHASTLMDAMMGGQMLVNGLFSLPLSSAILIQDFLTPKTYAQSPIDFCGVDMYANVYDFNNSIEPLTNSYVIKDMHITSVSHSVGADGNPVSEDYAFIAKYVWKFNAPYRLDIITNSKS